MCKFTKEKPIVGKIVYDTMLSFALNGQRS
jgi:hypothetical protein